MLDHVKNSQHTIEQFTDEFLTFYAELIVKYKNLICLGYFNVHTNDQCDHINDQFFSDIMYAMGLDQHVEQHTGLYHYRICVFIWYL